ncbi:MAG: DUF2911 domain-containing protein [Sphingobacteriales bacterium]|nr:MAG: DUF2911 domain-containing protein [Sphingobacteriales bacterium]
MKRFILSSLLVAAVLFTTAQQIQTAPASTTQSIKQNFGLGSVELNYSRPSLKGRQLGMVDFVPYGKVWRTGANAATTLQFTEDVTIGGTPVKAGKYGLLSIPDAGEWILIITKDVNINNPALYKQENDVVRVKAAVKKLSDKVETFTINFGEVTNNSMDMQLSFANTMLSLPISTNTDEKVMKQIDNIFNKDSKPYYAAAQYYFDNGKDISKAKEWIDKASADPAYAKSMNVFWLKARIYQKAGDKTAAKVAAEKLLTLATDAKNDDYKKRAEDILKAL